MAVTQWETYLEDNRSRHESELMDLLRIPSISSLPEHADDVRHAAEWVALRLGDAGIEDVQILPTGGHPVVYGQWLHAPGKPTVLIYGHFDVQPIDPIELWESPPFVPTVRDGCAYARGASDMKGNLLITVAAVEALLKTAGALPVNLKFLLEGQEEIGSPQLPAFVASHRDLLACDLAISADGGQWSEEQPVLPIGLKGLAGLQIDVHGANSDLHSGGYGGVVQNPIHALVQLLASMRSADGTILVEGFYDDVRPLTDRDREQMAAFPLDEEDYKARLGLDELFGEAGYSAIERAWARPTLEVNGIWGGFQGEGIKTVLPNQAHAKITCRLVPDQEPERIIDLLKGHIQRNTPRGVRITISPFPSRARPYLIPADHWGNEIACGALREVYGRDPLYIRSGGSVPVCETILTNLGAYTVTAGFGLNDEQIHAPNEFWRLASFERGKRVWVRLIQALSAAHPS